MARASLARASLARFIMTQYQFGACHSDAFLIFAPMLIQYAILFLRRKASLARTTRISFLCIFPFCEEPLSTPVWRVSLWRVYPFAYFSFVRCIVCVISVLICKAMSSKTISASEVLNAARLSSF